MIEAQVDKEQPMATWVRQGERILSQCLFHTSERSRGIVTKEMKLLLLVMCQILKGGSDVHFTDPFVSFSNDKEWLFAQDQGSFLDVTCGTYAPSFSR